MLSPTTVMLRAIWNAVIAAGLADLKKPDGIMARAVWTTRRASRVGFPLLPHRWFEHEIACLCRPHELVGLRAPDRSEWLALFERALWIAWETEVTPLDVLSWLKCTDVVARLDFRPAPVKDGGERASVRVDPGGICEMALACWGLLLEQRAGTGDRYRPYREAAKALKTLRRVLPSIVNESQLAGDSRFVTHCNLLSAAMAADFPVPPRPRRGREWAPSAPELAELYGKMMVDPVPGWSRDGSAVKFLYHALKHIYPGSGVTDSAIETELFNYRKRRRATHFRRPENT